MKNKQSIHVSVKYEPNRFSSDVESDVYERLYPQQKYPVTEQSNQPASPKKKAQSKEQKS